MHSNDAGRSDIAVVLFEFLVLSAINLALIALIIRKWSVLSAEGLCMAYLAAAVASDNAELLFDYFFRPQRLPLGIHEIAFRLYPTEVHIFGLLLLMFGLFTANPAVKSVTRDLEREDLRRLGNMGVAVALVGLALSAVALYLAGAFSGSGFYTALNSFRSGPVSFGGFWYRGADVAVFGLALTLPALRGKMLLLTLVFLVMLTISFFLRTNKGGLEEPILWGAVTLAIYNRERFRLLLRPHVIAVGLLLAFAGVGAKMLFLPVVLRDASPSTSVNKALDLANAAVGTRWGDHGLYRGYCQFVHMLPYERQVFHDSRVAMYTFTSWIPRLLYPAKPDHPFRGIGYMIYSDYHAPAEETPAPTLVGSALADDGLASLTVSLFLAGIFLGLLRRWATRSGASLWLHVFYVFFMLFGGFSAEEGTLGAPSMLILGAGVLLFARMLLFTCAFLRIHERDEAVLAEFIFVGKEAK